MSTTAVATVQNPQLRAVADEFQQATVRAHLVAGRSGEMWAKQPVAGSWSVGECIIHLNITTQEFLPRLKQEMEDARGKGVLVKGEYSRDIIGWLLSSILEPPYRMKVKTGAKFVPPAVPACGTVMAEFDARQAELLSAVQYAEGLDLNKVKVLSPFDPRGKMRYNAYSVFRIMAAHQRRHLWQAEQALAALQK